MSMRQSKKLKHVPVYDSDTGLIAGYTMGFQYGDFSHTEGLFFMDLEERWRRVDTGEIQLMGQDAVFLKPGARALILDKSPEKAAEQKPPVPVYNGTGASVGRASDILLEEDTIVGVEISDGLIHDVLSGRSLLLYRDILKWGPDMILVRPDAILYTPQYSRLSRAGRLLFLLFLLALLWPARVLARPVLLGLLVAYGLFPAVSFFRRRGFKQTSAAFAAFALLVFGAAALLLLLAPLLNGEMAELASVLPQIFEKISSLIAEAPKYASRLNLRITPERWQLLLDDWQLKLGVWLQERLSGIGASLTSMVDWLLAPVLAFYFLKEWERIKGWILGVFSVRAQGDLVYLGGEIHKIIKGFLKGNLFTSLVVGVLTYIALALLGLDFPGILGLLAGLGNLIPYFGAIISTVPVVLLCLLQAPWKGVAAVVLVVLIQQLESNVLTPRILGESLDLPPLTIILALILGGEFFGILGMFMAAPVAAIIKAVGKRIIAQLV